MKKIITREAKYSDQQVVLDLLKILNKDTCENGFIQRYFSTIESPDSAIFVSCLGESVVGFVEAKSIYTLQSPRHTIIKALFVSENYRNLGVASRLLDCIENWTNRSGSESIVVGSRTRREDAKQFYISKGFELFKEHNIFKKKLNSIA